MKRYLFAITLFSCAAVVGCNSSSTSVSPAVESVSEVSKASAVSGSTAPPISAEPVSEPMEGYTLIAPLRSKATYLLNNDKEIVHSWQSEYPPAGTAYLLGNGDLLRGARDPEFSHFRGGGIGYKIERYNWDGDLIWSFQYANEDHCFHHDIAPMPNGNLLMIAWERKSKEEAIAQGRDPELLRDDLWPGHVIEVQPDGTDGGTVVWEWHMWDHLVQDFDREKPNYGVIYEHPELIDLNNTGSTPPSTPEELRKLRAVGYTGGGDDDDDRRRGSADWLHTNAIDYNPELDQIALSAKNFSEIWVIDHSTTTEEAASHRGGKQGKGGDLLYRWGNPWSYKSGTVEDKMLFDQHDVRWIPPGYPGEGHVMSFNNGKGREYSSIIEIEPPIDEDGSYILDDEGRYGPYELAWEYTAENPKDFYSSFISGATRLPNGSTFICEGATGRFFEVNSIGKKLWEHINTYGGELDMEGRVNDVEKEARKIIKDGEGNQSFVHNNALFRATKYHPGYEGLVGRTLEPLAEQPIPFATLVEETVVRLRATEPELEGAGESTDIETETNNAAGDEDSHHKVNHDEDNTRNDQNETDDQPQPHGDTADDESDSDHATAGEPEVENSDEAEQAAEAKPVTADSGT